MQAATPSATPSATLGAVLVAALAATVAAFALGLALGAMSWAFMVVGLWALATGLAVGIVLATLYLAQGAAPRRGLVVASALVAALAGWGAMRIIEDGHLVDQFRGEVARSRAASTGLPSAELERVLAAPGAIDYWARGAELDLEQQVAAEVGFGGVIGRWWWRAGNGVRLAGSWSGSRGLPVGRGGALVWTFIELGLAAWIALRVTTRGRMVEVSPRTPSAP